MKPSTKRSFCFGLFLVVVTLVVLYSYCNGNSVCYTFPFLTGLGQNRVVKPEAEMVVTSVIVHTKGPFGVQTIPGKQDQGGSEDASVKLSELPITSKQETKQETTTNFETGNSNIHLYQNRTSLEKNLFGHSAQDLNRTRVKETFHNTTHVLPPSDIVGKVAEEILRRANVSEEDANRELIRVEKVDKTIDKEEEYNKTSRAEGKLTHRGISFLQKIKDARNPGQGQKPDRTLVRVERVDLTDEDEEPDEPVSRETADISHPSTDSSSKPKYVTYVENGDLTANIAHATTKGTDQNKTETKPPSLVSGKNADEPQRGENDPNLDKPNNTNRVVAPTRKPPQFFLKFLNFTKEERKLVDSLVNYNNNNSTVHDGRAVNASGNGTERTIKEESKGIPVSSAHAMKDEARDKRDSKESDENSSQHAFPPLLVKLLNLTSKGERLIKHNKSSSLKLQQSFEELNGPLNLSRILGTIADESHDLTDKGFQTQAPDSTALLLKFLTEGSRHIPRMPRNDTSAYEITEHSGSTKIDKHETQPINLKKAIMELTNHMNFTDHENNSNPSPDYEKKSLDLLLLLKLLSRPGASPDLSSFNLSKVLKEISGKSLKSSLTALGPIKGRPEKREAKEEELGSSQPEIKIFGPVVDILENSKPVPVFSTDRRPSAMFKPRVTSFSRESDTTFDKHPASFSSGSGSGESGDEDPERVDSERRKSRNLQAKKKSDKRQRIKQGANGILKFDKISCEALDPKILLYNRIFKTGSTTTESLVINSSVPLNYDYKIGTTEDWYGNGDSRPYPGLIVRKANKKLKKHPRMAFVAHFYFRRNLDLPQAHTYINQVRDPIRRFVSHYFYMRSANRPTHRIRQFMSSKERNESLGECFRLQHKGCKNNVMTRFFCGKHSYCPKGNGRALKKAITNIKRYYAAVGLLEDYDVYLQILQKRLPNFFPHVSKSEIGKFKYNSKYNFDSVPADLIKSITRANWADVKLYSFIKQRFWQQAKACGIVPS